MDPEVRKEFDEMRETVRRNEAASKASYDRAMKRMDRMDRRHEEAMTRMDKFDKKLEATRRLVEMGMKLMMQLRQSQKETSAQIKATDAQLKALIAFRSGGNGRGH
jgi:hypothetical protein